METLLRDVRVGLRILRKNLGYTAVALVALALGIGANAAIFSVVNALLLRPLPYIDSRRLVVVDTGDRETGADQFQGMSPADFRDYSDQSATFEQLACYSGGGFSLTGVENPESVPGTRVSPNYFDMLKARPLLGRTFREEDGFAKSPDTIILSYRLWQRYFGGDESIIGKTLGDTGTEVIGVMPPDFEWPDYAECWIPLSRDSGEMQNRSNRYFSALGLIRSDQSLESADAQLKTVAALDVISGVSTIRCSSAAPAGLTCRPSFA